METGELFATKGIEYVLVITYLLLLVGGWKFVFPKSARARTTQEHGGVPDGYFFHQGHTWAELVDERTVRVGIDDFAQKAIGHASEFVLPTPGTPVNQGEAGWEVRRAGEYFAMVSPVTGVVTAVNGDVVQSPGLVNAHPYGEGWLVEVHLSNEACLRNLLTGEVAEFWMEQANRVPPEDAIEVLLASEQLSEGLGSRVKV